MSAAIKKMTADEKDLVFRYLLWFYKTTKEQLDKIDRKFTQLKADYVVIQALEKQPDKNKAAYKEISSKYLKQAKDFKKYVLHKEKAAWGQKFADTKGVRFQPEYYYLSRKVKAIEEAAVQLLGKKALVDIRKMYQEEMVKRILSSTARD